MKSLPLLLAAALLLAGCQIRLDRRIDANRSTWNQLNDNDRQRLAHGHARVGDSEGAVRIALGAPDRTLVITGDDGRQRTVWQYDTIVDDSEVLALSPTPRIPHPYTRTQTVTFREGVVETLVGAITQPYPARNAEGEHMVGRRADEITRKIVPTPEEQAGHAAFAMTASLNDLVQLTPAQRRQAHTIYRVAQLQLRRLTPGDRPSKGLPIRQKMRADIRAILTPEQQAKLDAGFRSPIEDGVLVVRN